MSTPVPKCRLKKRKRCGMGKEGKRFAIMGKAQAKTERMRIRKRAKTWMGVL